MKYIAVALSHTFHGCVCRFYNCVLPLLSLFQTEAWNVFQASVKVMRMFTCFTDSSRRTESLLTILNHYAIHTGLVTR